MNTPVSRGTGRNPPDENACGPSLISGGSRTFRVPAARIYPGSVTSPWHERQGDPGDLPRGGEGLGTQADLDSWSLDPADAPHHDPATHSSDGDQSRR